MSCTDAPVIERRDAAERLHAAIDQVVRSLCSDGHRVRVARACKVRWRAIYYRIANGNLVHDYHEDDLANLADLEVEVYGTAELRAALVVYAVRRPLRFLGLTVAALATLVLVAAIQLSNQVARRPRRRRYDAVLTIADDDDRKRGKQAEVRGLPV